VRKNEFIAEKKPKAAVFKRAGILTGTNLQTERKNKRTQQFSLKYYETINSKVRFSHLVVARVFSRKKRSPRGRSTGKKGTWSKGKKREPGKREIRKNGKKQEDPKENDRNEILQKKEKKRNQYPDAF